MHARGAHARLESKLSMQIKRVSIEKSLQSVCDGATTINSRVARCLLRPPLSAAARRRPPPCCACADDGPPLPLVHLAMHGRRGGVRKKMFMERPREGSERNLIGDGSRSSRVRLAPIALASRARRSIPLHPPPLSSFDCCVRRTSVDCNNDDARRLEVRSSLLEESLRNRHWIFRSAACQLQTQTTPRRTVADPSEKHRQACVETGAGEQMRKHDLIGRMLGTLTTSSSRRETQSAWTSNESRPGHHGGAVQEREERRRGGSR